MGQLPLMPEQASTFAKDYDLIFLATTALTIFFTVIVGAIVVIFAVRYRQGKKVDRSNPIHGHQMLELTWSGIPLLLALVMFAWNAEKFVESRIPPKDAMEIFVIGKQWMWHVQHPNGIRENNTLTVPVGKPVKLTMISQDTLHSFYVPQFRIKQDVLPGRYTSQWFTATKTGKFNLFCTEYCGLQHSEMGGYVYVLSEKDYARWVSNQGEPVNKDATLADKGKILWDRYLCGNCHGSKDSERGPSLYGLVGRSRTMDNGQTVVADQAYIRESILQPYNKILKGYDKTMPEYKDQFTEAQVLELFEYMKTIGQASAPTNIVAQASTNGDRAN